MPKMIALPEGFSALQFVSEIAPLGVYMVTAYVVIIALNYSLRALRGRRF